LNLYSYVENPFTPNAKFNWELFKEHSIYGQRFMDDIIDLEIEKIDTILLKIDSDPEPEDIKRTERELWIKIMEKAKQGRRTGLGTTAEGDMLAALGLKYGTSAGTEFSEQVHKSLAISAYKSSIIMAKERGAFEIWNFEQEINNPFIQRIWENLDDEFREMFKTYGRRNISMLTIAPNGSVSLMTQTTSGIEPAFMIAYMRRRKINPNDKSTKATFTDESGDMWEEYNVFHSKFKDWALINGYDVNLLENMNSTDLQSVIEKSPYFGATSDDVNWIEKVVMQGKIQKWIDHSISVTVNLPNNVPEELIGEVYEMGWKSGCKGITVYRDGSRSGVLVAKDTKKADIFTENDAPKRPKILPCDIMRFTIKGEKWIGFLGLYENRPYEIFTGVQDKVGIPTYVETGEIVKVKIKDDTSRYDFIYTDKDGYQQEFKGLNRTFNREYWNSARTISALFRHGMPLPNIMAFVDKLDFEDSGSLVSWKNGVKRMIKRYVKDGTKVMGETCPDCGSSKIIYKEGCVTCLECSWSKCS
jgi:ribonucleoside-diphosphate reductase alpha chain